MGSAPALQGQVIRRAEMPASSKNISRAAADQQEFPLEPLARVHFSMCRLLEKERQPPRV